MTIVPSVRTPRKRVRLAATSLALTAAAVLLAPVQRAGAQQQHDQQHAGHETTTTHADGAMGDHAMGDHAMADGAMSDPRRMHDMSAHMRMTRPRPATDDDRRRGAALVTTLRSSLARYRDVRAARADGYAMFAPGVKGQRVYHFTKKWSAVKAAFTFDPSSPTSLLYEQDERGSYRLVGAMYTAPKGASEDELNARVPLSIARWHQHVNVCVPKRRDRDRWTEMDGDRMRFGPAGTIATREACDAAGGRFIPQLFGWMVHANVFESDDPAVIWGEMK